MRTDSGAPPRPTHVHANGAATAEVTGFGEQVRIVSSLTRSGSSIGQSDSIVNAIRMRLEDAGHRVCGVPVVYEDLDGGARSGAPGTRRAEANARYAAAQPDVLAYIGTLDADAAAYSIPITNTADLLMISPCNTYPGLTKSFEPGSPTSTTRPAAATISAAR